MKNVMIIDGAENCAYDIFAFTDEEFDKIFGDKDIQFIDEIQLLDIGEEEVDEIFSRVWSRPVEKKLVAGIHGMIFYELERKKRCYPNRLDSDLDRSGRSASVVSELKKQRKHVVVVGNKRT